MSDRDPRATERERREVAESHRGEVVEGSGRAVSPRDMVQMVSVRLDSKLVAELRSIADERQVTVSELLREGAAYIIATARLVPYRLIVGPVEMAGSSSSQLWHVTGTAAVKTSA